MHLKMSSGKWRPFCLDLNVLRSGRSALFIMYHQPHYIDVIMSEVASQITGVSIVYLTGCSGADQSKHQSSASLAFVSGIQRWPMNSPHKRVSIAENVPIWWRHHAYSCIFVMLCCGFEMVDFIHSPLSYVASAIIWLPQSQMKKIGIWW